MGTIETAGATRMERVVHTPGPWRTSNVVSAYETKRRKIISSEESVESGTGICEVYGVEDGDNIANARLIAAAPELLEALRDAMFMLRDFGYVLDGSRTTKMKRAFEKATGEPW